MKKIWVLLLICTLAGCGGKGQSIFYWYRENTGPAWFARDHRQCLDKADYWPWSLPAWPIGTEKPLDMRFDNDASNGIWANFQPYPGAQPVYVNSVAADWSMSVTSYRRCMENRGYIQREPRIVHRQVHQQ